MENLGETIHFSFDANDDAELIIEFQFPKHRGALQFNQQKEEELLDFMTDGICRGCWTDVPGDGGMLCKNCLDNEMSRHGIRRDL